jgi:prepilin-type N-terminal cleavage/methylation domain-containing protein
MSHTARHAPRGFTLIELMIVVSIVGLLSSIAVPVFEKMTLRTRQAEREAIMRAVAKGVEDVALNAAVIPVNSGTFFVGNWNPVPIPDTSKHAWLQAQAGWRDLPLIIEGATYFAYQFILDTSATPMRLIVRSAGDLDGDGVYGEKWQVYDGVGHSFVMLPPPLGEYETTPGAF